MKLIAGFCLLKPLQNPKKHYKMTIAHNFRQLLQREMVTQDMKRYLISMLIIIIFFTMELNVSAIQISKSSNHSKTSTIHSVQVNGNRLLVQADNQIKPSIMRLKQPERLVLTFTNAQLELNVNHAEFSLDNHPLIRKVRYANFSNEPPMVRVVADLEGNIPFELKSDQPDSVIVSLDSIKSAVDVGEATTDDPIDSITTAAPTAIPSATPNLTPEPISKLDDPTPTPEQKSENKLIDAQMNDSTLELSFDQAVSVTKDNSTIDTGLNVTYTFNTTLFDHKQITILENGLVRLVRWKGVKNASWKMTDTGGFLQLSLTLDPGYTAFLTADKDQKTIGIQAKIVRAKVVIDAGHGGFDVGATSIRKHYEKDLTLSVAEMVRDELLKHSSIEPILTRSDDRFITLEKRAQFAAQMNADLFISIHGNSNIKSSVRGTETYFFKKDSQELAQVMHKHVLKATQLPDRKVKTAKYFVLRNNTVPATLLELGYLSNGVDEAKLMRVSIKRQIAIEIAAGIEEYVNTKLAP